MLDHVALRGHSTTVSATNGERQTMKARVLAATLDGRVSGAGDAEIRRAVHPAEAACEGDVAIAMSPDAIRILGESRAKIVLVPEGTEFPHQQFQTVIFLRRSRSN